MHCAKSCPGSLECQNRTTSEETAELLSSKSLVSWQLPARREMCLTWRNFNFYQQNSWMMHISTFSLYTEKLLTIIFTLKYTLQIRKAALKMALNRKPLYNHGQPSERGNNKVLFKTGSPLYMIKGLQKYCSDLHLNLLITCSFSLPSQRSNL